MIDRIAEFIAQLGAWGYLLVFAAATLESAAFFGLLVPGETTVVLSGFMASLGVFRLPELIAIVSFGAVLGDSLGYELGRRFGRPWLLRYGRWIWITAADLDMVEGYFSRHGGKTIFFARFIGILRALAPFVAGSSRMRYSYFLMYNVMGGVLWAVTFVLLGFFLGAGWRIVEKRLGQFGIFLGGTVLTLLLSIWLWRKFVRKQQKSSE